MNVTARLTTLALILGCVGSVAGQPRVQLPSSVPDAWSGYGLPATGGLSNVGAPPPGTGATLGAPVFDVYGNGAGGGGLLNWSNQAPAPVVPANPPSGGLFGGLFGGGGAATPYGAPGYGANPYGTAPLGAPGYGAPGYGTDPLLNGTNPYPASAPPSIFPNGMFPQGAPSWQNSTQFMVPRVRYTWLHGNGGEDLEIHDVDASLVFIWPQFLFTQQPLYVAPSFGLHLWEGPARPPGNLADLPGRAFSAYLDAGWQSNPQNAVGAEIGGRVGVFSDFDTYTSDSIRIQGKGLLLLRLTPTVQIKGGVYYVDRIPIKIFPAGGILWTPNPQARFDLNFPNPKISQYLTTVGNTELWWYLAGEYGGGAWTVRRATNMLADEVDLSDIRLSTGIEWGPGQLFQRGRRVGFFEAGWVTRRRIRYHYNPGDDLDLQDTFMLRTGFGY